MGNVLTFNTGEPDFEEGIQVSGEFVARLAGLKPSQAPIVQPPAFLPPRVSALQAAAQEQIETDKELRQAHDKSRYIGGLLLKNEGEELQKVQQHANELIEREYSAPCGAVPCQEHSKAVLDCYTKNSQDVLQCGPVVDAYAKCADEARHRWASSVHSSSVR